MRDRTNPPFTLSIMAERLLTDRYRDQSTKAESNPFDFDIWIAVREYRGKLYLIPNCGIGANGCLAFLKKDQRLEDFAYWNNSDKPQHLSEKSWTARGAVWDALNLGPTVAGQLCTDTWSDYLVLEICSYASFWKVKPRFR